MAIDKRYLGEAKAAPCCPSENRTDIRTRTPRDRFSLTNPYAGPVLPISERYKSPESAARTSRQFTGQGKISFSIDDVACKKNDLWPFFRENSERGVNILGHS